MLRIVFVLLISFTFTQCIVHKSKQKNMFDSVISRASVNGSSIQPDNSTCSDPRKGGSCISISRCPKLFELYQRSATLSSNETKSVQDAFCGWSEGAAFVCCGTAPTAKSELHCGDSIVKSRSKIPGGRVAKLGAWPWMVALYGRSDRTNKTAFRCSGTLISKEWVLTAANCVPNFTYDKLVNVRLGDLNINNTVKDGATPIEIDIKEVIKHPSYSIHPVSNDIAVLRLSKPVEYNENIRPICLHAGKTFQQNITLYDRKKPLTAGWGTLEYLGERSNDLLEADVRVVPLSKCSKNYERFVKLNQIRIDETVVCASGPDKESCQGDGGSPLMFIENNYWYQIGIVSAGYKCNLEDYPGVYTKVISFIDWINETTGLNF